MESLTVHLAVTYDTIPNTMNIFMIYIYDEYMYIYVYIYLYVCVYVCVRTYYFSIQYFILPNLKTMTMRCYSYLWKCTKGCSKGNGDISRLKPISSNCDNA